MYESSERKIHFPQPFGKYTLVSHLATGGMAYVYLARQSGFAGFEKECVIKRILPHLAENQEFLEMFLDEARLVARLSHPNIVQIFDLGQTEKDFFLAMEYVDGCDLGKLLRRAQEQGAPAVPWPLATRIIADAAAGLAHAHQATDAQGQPLHLVHRDISPANIMVSWGGTTKVLDFGIASADAKGSHTTVGTIKGRLPYMSPEQLQGHGLDGRSDLFSLAVVYYELLYGQRPFPADGMGALTLQILQQEPTPPSDIASKIPRRLQLILARALSKQPEDRWQSMRVFQRALEQLLTEQQSDCTSYHVETYLQRLFPETANSQNKPPLDSAAWFVSQETQRTIPASVIENPSQVRHSPEPLRRWALLGGLLCMSLGAGIMSLYLATKGSSHAVKTTPAEPVPSPAPVGPSTSSTPLLPFWVSPSLYPFSVYPLHLPTPKTAREPAKPVKAEGVVRTTPTFAPSSPPTQALPPMPSSREASLPPASTQATLEPPQTTATTEAGNSLPSSGNTEPAPAPLQVDTHPPEPSKAASRPEGEPTPPSSPADFMPPGNEPEPPAQ